jgi:hypothetical protein
MVFHRFLTGEARRRKRLTILVNGNPVEPWDPFARNEKGTEEFDPIEFDVHGENGKGIVRFQGFVLPHKDRFSSPKAFEKVGGPNRWNSQQGFYIYRADRMIQSGGWSRMRTPDEHTKLARAAIDFYPDLDPDFKINVAKMRVSLPNELKDELKEHVERLAKRARLVYDQKERNSGEATTNSNRNQTSSSAQYNAPVEYSKAIPRLYKTYAASLEAAAVKVGETGALRRVANRLKTEEPEVARELGW